MPYPNAILRRSQARLALLTLVGTLGACANFDRATTSMVGVITPYRVDVVQGNFVSREQAAALKPGMSRNQVREVLGTPLLASLFHADRWDYVFTFRRQGSEPQSRRLAVYFKNDLMDRIEAGELPTEVEFLASLDSGRIRDAVVPNLQASEEVLVKYASPSVTAPALALPPAPASYPPLEPSGGASR
jgi:outer membrane protein assembly factor BamE